MNFSKISFHLKKDKNTVVESLDKASGYPKDLHRVFQMFFLGIMRFPATYPRIHSLYYYFY